MANNESNLPTITNITAGLLVIMVIVVPTSIILTKKTAKITTTTPRVSITDEILITKQDSEFKKILIYLNNGNRKFTEHMNYSIGTDPLFLTTEDLNADGYSDIIIGYRSAEGVNVQLNDGNGMFPGEAVFYRTVCASHFVTIADLNGDHTLDIIALCPSVHKIVILFNNCHNNGTFSKQMTYETDQIPVWVAINDVNNDDKFDIVVANFDPANIGIFLNTGNDTFVNQTLYPTDYNPYAIAINDVNDDHQLDIIVAHSHSVGILYTDCH
ncbi:unnamed protein product [Rotaria sordida]|uniref:VCBS repeat-containing protein n=1 Tax=Rotaria sordida TaxID=392033 RepID=A0A813ZAK8_9BILA|nr:unnamed protein product [Rotaria sordida]CAF3801198.1 unnamed protein product [Rotaria sordida]